MAAPSPSSARSAVVSLDGVLGDSRRAYTTDWVQDRSRPHTTSGAASSRHGSIGGALRTIGYDRTIGVHPSQASPSAAGTTAAAVITTSSVSTRSDQSLWQQQHQQEQQQFRRLPESAMGDRTRSGLGVGAGGVGGGGGVELCSGKDLSHHAQSIR